jgi:hypothetical protein
VFDFSSRELVREEAPFERLGRRVLSGSRFCDEPFVHGIATLAPAREHVERHPAIVPASY